MPQQRIEQFSARRLGQEPVSTVFEQALAGWRRNHPGAAPTHAFASAGIQPIDKLALESLAANQALAVELRRDVAPFEIGVGVHLASVPPFAVDPLENQGAGGQGDSDA